MSWLPKSRFPQRHKVVRESNIFICSWYSGSVSGCCSQSPTQNSSLKRKGTTSWKRLSPPRKDHFWICLYSDKLWSLFFHAVSEYSDSVDYSKLTGTWFSTQHRLTLKIPHMEQGWCWDASTTSTAFVQPLLHHRLTSCFKKNNLRFYFKLKYRLLIQSICSINKYMNFLIQVEMLRHWRKYSRWNRQVINNVLLSLRFPKVNLTEESNHSNESVTSHYSSS